MSDDIDLLFTRHTDATLGPARQTLLDVYEEVYAEHLHEPFRSLAEFDRRLTGYTAAPGWECVIATTDDQPVGFAYGHTLQPGARWWHGLTSDADAEQTREDGERTFALNDIMVRTPWRGTTIARRIHDALISARPEPRVTLLVDETHPGARRRYEEWGYHRLGSLHPDIPHAPVFDALILEKRP